MVVENESTVCVETALPYVEPSNNVDIQMPKSKLKNGKPSGLDHIPAELKEGKSLRTSFMNSSKKCGRKRSYHGSRNVT